MVLLERSKSVKENSNLYKEFYHLVIELQDMRLTGAIFNFPRQLEIADRVAAIRAELGD